jgi:hypothetical protein
MRWICLVLLVAGCSSTVHLYEGERRPDEELAFVEPHHFMIWSIDDVPLEQSVRLRRKTLALLPGEHVIRIEWEAGPDYPTQLPAYPGASAAYHLGAESLGLIERFKRYFATIRFEAEPGHHYRGVWVEVVGEGPRAPALEHVEARRP